MKMIDLRKQIRSELRRRDISIPAMARRLECHPQTLYDFLSGKKALTADYLEGLLNELGGRLIFEK